MKVSLEKIFPLDTNYTFHFIVLGCGGTGSAFIPRLCALLSTIGHRHTVSICDGDKVEPKNLQRQNFFTQDLEKNKAQVLAAKCNTMFNVPVTAYDKYIENVEELSNLCFNGEGVPFIVGCVDTNAVRRMIHEYVSNYTGTIFWLDSGNEEFVGQVVLAHNIAQSKTVKRVIGDSPETDTFRFYLPDVTYFFPDMLESKEIFASELSCAEHAVSHPQAAITNVTAATLLLQFCSACLEGAINFHKVTFDAQRATFNTVLNYESVLLKYGNTMSPKFKKELASDARPVRGKAKAAIADLNAELAAEVIDRTANIMAETARLMMEPTEEAERVDVTDTPVTAETVTTQTTEAPQRQLVFLNDTEFGQF